MAFMNNKKKVAVYVDGFNLYHGLKNLIFFHCNNPAGEVTVYAWVASLINTSHVT